MESGLLRFFLLFKNRQPPQNRKRKRRRGTSVGGIQPLPSLVEVEHRGCSSSELSSLVEFCTPSRGTRGRSTPIWKSSDRSQKGKIEKKSKEFFTEGDLSTVNVPPRWRGISVVVWWDLLCSFGFPVAIWPQMSHCHSISRELAIDEAEKGDEKGRRRG